MKASRNVFTAALHNQALEVKEEIFARAVERDLAHFLFGNRVQGSS
jgi:hypothetical protein